MHPLSYYRLKHDLILIIHSNKSKPRLIHNSNVIKRLINNLAMCNSIIIAFLNLSIISRITLIDYWKWKTSNFARILLAILKLSILFIYRVRIHIKIRNFASISFIKYNNTIKYNNIVRICPQLTKYITAVSPRRVFSI